MQNTAYVMTEESDDSGENGRNNQRIEDIVLFTEYENLLSLTSSTSMGYGDRVEELRKMILRHGLPSERSIGFDQLSSLRSKAWKLLLGVPCILSSQEYCAKWKVCIFQYANYICSLFG
jgi:hypothetical protein